MLILVAEYIYNNMNKILTDIHGLIFLKINTSFKLCGFIFYIIIASFKVVYGVNIAY